MSEPKIYSAEWWKKMEANRTEKAESFAGGAEVMSILSARQMVIDAIKWLREQGRLKNA